MNERVTEMVERLEKLFQKVHEGLPGGVSYIRKSVAPLLTPREGEILKDIVTEEVDRYGDETAGGWSRKVREDALYRTSVWVLVAKRVVAKRVAAEEAAP